MNIDNDESIDQIAIRGLHTKVPGDHVRKIEALINVSKREFKNVFSDPDSNDQAVNQIVGIEIDAWTDKDNEKQVLSTAMSVRKPIDWGPKPRKPIRCGGSKCYTIKIGDYTYTICIDWEGPCNKLAF